MAFFGPAGNSNSFFEMGYKDSESVPEYVEKMGLNAFEYQCGRGVHIGLSKCEAIKKEAEKHNVRMSLHAPYYISMSSADEEKRLNSLKYILQSARAVDAMGGDRIVIHTGSVGKYSRQEALLKAKDTMSLALELLKSEGLSHIRMCPETMGKTNQLGTLEEVLEICTLDESLIPCIDFGHLNARTHGGLKSYDDFLNVFNMVEDKIGLSRLREFHSHFSKIEYSTGGEKRHLTFADSVYGPDFEYMLEIAYKKGCEPTVICESDGTQSEDAKQMMDYFNGLSK